MRALLPIALLALAACDSAHAFPLDIESEPAATPIASAPVDDLAETHHFIATLADDASDLPDWSDDSLSSRVQPIAKRELTPQVLRSAELELTARAVLNHQGSIDSGGARFTSETPFLAIVREGVIVGFVVAIEDTLDHPSWDGSGVSLYFDARGTIVTDVEWAG